MSLYARDGDVWMNQNQLAELFTISVPNINTHIANILKEKELLSDSVIKDYLITATDSKQYKVKFYALDMILAIGFRVRGTRGTEFQRQTRPSQSGARQPCAHGATRRRPIRPVRHAAQAREADAKDLQELGELEKVVARDKRGES